MATAKEQLLSMMNPQQARLLDQQMRGQQVAQRSQGAGMLSGLVQAYTGMGDVAQRATGITPMGRNEQMAMQQQQSQKKMMDAMSVAQGKSRVEELRAQAKALRETGDYNAFMRAEQLDLRADEMSMKLDELNIRRTKLMMDANTPSSSKGMSSTEGEHFADTAGNQYATVLVTNKDTGTSQVNYIPLGNAPEYDGTTPLKAVIKSGSYVGMDPLEAADLEAAKAGDVALAKDFNNIKVEAAQNFSTAKSTHSSLVKALEMTKQAAEMGQLEGGIQANLQNVYYNLFGKRPKNLGELNMIFNESTFARLKPLFGGNISNGEREAVQGTYMDVLKGGEVNIGVIEQLIAKANGAMFNYNVLMTSDSYEDWINKLAQDKPESTKDKNVVKRRKYNPETGEFEEF